MRLWVAAIRKLNISQWIAESLTSAEPKRLVLEQFHKLLLSRQIRYKKK
jgi:hypothetical protein